MTERISDKMCDEEEPKDEEAGDIKIENPVLSNYYLDFSHSFDQHFEVIISDTSYNRIRQ